jgi:hypothetical protein
MPIPGGWRGAPAVLTVARRLSGSERVTGWLEGRCPDAAV